MFFNVNVINKIDEFFSKIFKGLKDVITWGTLGTLIAGIIIGLVIAATIYSIWLTRSLYQKEKEVATTIKKIEDEKLQAIVEQIKNNYVEETESLTITERFTTLGNKLFELVNEIASLYYPESKYPLYELTIEELILFVHYLSNRIGAIFDKPVLAPFKRLSIAGILRILDTKRQIDENKAVKVMKKTNKVTSFLVSALKFANPIYWLKKLLLGTTINFAMRKVALLIIDIVADETTKTYSKTIFDQERALKQLDIEKALQALEKEELDA